MNGYLSDEIEYDYHSIEAHQLPRYLRGFLVCNGEFIFIHETDVELSACLPWLVIRVNGSIEFRETDLVVVATVRDRSRKKPKGIKRMSDKPAKYVAFELVGGPHDGQIHHCKPGVMTICIPHGNQIFTYCRGKDGRLHFTPVINGERLPPPC